MGNRLCMRLGGIAGAAVGLLVSLLHDAPCCASPPGPPLSIGIQIVAGIIVALIVTFLCANFVRIVRRLPALPIFWLAFLIGLFVGGLLGPVAYLFTNAAIALFVCGILGAWIGWLLCWLMCGKRGYAWGR